MIEINDIIYNHKIINYEYLDWIKYISGFEKYTPVEYFYQIIKELDCSKINKKGQQLMSIHHYEYPLLINNAIKVLDRILDYRLYNDLFLYLVSCHERNLEICKEYDEEQRNKQTIKNPKTRAKKTKIKDEYLKSISTDLFTGKTNYIYSNLKTGDEIISDNPDLLEELNKPKERKKKTPKVLSLPIGFSFKLK